MANDNYADITNFIESETSVHEMNKSNKDKFSDINEFLGIEAEPTSTEILIDPEKRGKSYGVSGEWEDESGVPPEILTGLKGENRKKKANLYKQATPEQRALYFPQTAATARVVAKGINARLYGAPKAIFGDIPPFQESESTAESIGTVGAEFYGFLKGPFALAKSLLGKTWAAREGSIAANYARMIGRGGLELGTAGGISEVIPAVSEEGLTREAGTRVNDAFKQSALFGMIFPAAGVIPTKPLRVVIGAGLTDLVRGRGEFTYDDTIRGLQDGTIDQQELVDRGFGYLMDVYFLTRTPSVKKQIESLIPFKRVDKLASMIANDKMQQGKYQEAVDIVNERFEKIKNDPEIKEKMSELVGKELEEIQKQLKTDKGRQAIIDKKMPKDLGDTLKLNAQARQAEIDRISAVATIPIEEAPKIAKAIKPPETTMQKIDKMIDEIKTLGEDIGYKPVLKRDKLQIPVGEKKPADTKLIEQDKRVQEVLSEIEKLEGLRTTAEKATGMNLKSIYDKAINEAIDTLPEGEKIELQSAISNFRKKVYVTGIEKYYAEKAAEKKATEVEVKEKQTAKETTPVKGKESPAPAKRTMEESVAAGEIPAPEYKGKERREVPEARQTVIDGYVRKELGVKGLGGKKLAPLTKSEKEVLALYEAKHPDYVKKVREDIKGREEPSKKAAEVDKKKEIDRVAKEHDVKYEGIQEGAEGEKFYTFTDKETGSTFMVSNLSKVERSVTDMRKKFKEAEKEPKEEVKVEPDAELSKTEVSIKELGELTPTQLVERAKKVGLEQTVWSKALSNREYVERQIVGKEGKPFEEMVKEPEIKIEPEIKPGLRTKFQKILAQDKLTQEDIKWLKENKEALDLTPEETQAIKMRMAGKLVKRIISEEKFQKNSESIKKYLKGLKVFTGVPDPKIIKAMSENAIYHIERKATSFYQWSQKMIKEFGNKIRPILHQAWTNAQNHINSARGYEAYKGRIVAGDKFSKVYIADSVTESLQNESKILNSYVSKGYISDKQLDVDLTYSTGKMYERAGFEKPKRRFDIKPRSVDVEKASVVDSVPIENMSVGSIMFDPPFLVGKQFAEIAKTYDKSKSSNIFGDRFGSFKDLNEAVNMWGSGIAEASRILKLDGKLFVKIQDTVSFGGDPRLEPSLETGVTKTKSGATRGKIPATQYLIDVASIYKLNLIEGVSKVSSMTSHPELKTIVNYMVFEKVKAPVVSPEISVSAERYQKSFDIIKKYFKGEKPYGEKLHAGIGLDPQLVKDISRVMRYHIEKGTKDFYRVSQELIKEFGEKVRPYLKPAFDQARDKIRLTSMTRKDIKYANDALVKMGLKTLSEAEAENISPETVNEPGLIKRFMSTLESTDQTLEAYKGGAQEHINAVPKIMVEETFIPKQQWIVEKFKQLDGAMKGVRRSVKADELSRVGKEANKLGREVSEVLELKDIADAKYKYSSKSIEIAKDVRKILDDILVELQDANVLDKKGKLIKRLEGYFPHIKKEFSMSEDLQRYMNDALEGRHDDIIGAASGGVDLYGTAKPVPKFGHAEKRAKGEYGLQDIETNPLRVLRRYVLAASRILYDKPGIEKARVEIDMIPKGPMKDLSVKYIQNYMRVSDSISGTLRLVDAKLARMGARSVLAFSTGLQTLHLGRVATQIWPELGTRYSLSGLNQLLMSPAKAWAETRDAGLLPQASIPTRFKFRGEVFDNISNYGDFGNSVAKIIAYQGFLRKVANQHPEWTFKQVQTEAIKQTIRAEGVINQATKSIALEKIPKFFLQFKYWFQKYGENTSRAIAYAAKDPSMDNMTRVGRYLTAAAITEEITRQLGLKIFHITPYVIQLSATGAGYLKDIAFILANDKDSIETRLEKAFKRTAQYGIPGGVSVPREITQGPTAIKKH